MKEIILAVDSFKGSLSASDVCINLENAIHDAVPSCNVISMPLSDGGEGMTDVLVSQRNGSIHSVMTFDPLMRSIEAKFGVIDNCVILEMASSAGLTLLPYYERNPLYTTSYGMGVMIKYAIDLGYKDFFVGIGGSATNDAGLGAMQALGLKCYDKYGNLISKPVTGSMLKNIYRLDMENMRFFLSNIHFKVACDVNNPFCGINGAAYVYAQQKGASNDDVRLLEIGMRSISDLLYADFNIDVNSISGAGAAGGMGAALYLFLHADLISGIDAVLDILKFDEYLKDADLVITGEGCVDSQSLMGKTLSGVLRRTVNYDVPLLVIGGRILTRNDLLSLGVIDCLEVSPRDMPINDVMIPSVAAQNIYNSMYEWLKRLDD